MTEIPPNLSPQGPVGPSDLPPIPAAPAGSDLPPAPLAFVTAPEGAARTAVSKLSIAGLVCGILSLCTLGVTAIPGLILSLWGLVRVRRSGGRLRGSGLAIGGIATSLIGAFVLLCVLMMGLFFMKLGDMNPGTIFDSYRASPNERTAQSMICLTNLVAAAQAYAGEHDGRLPPAAEFPSALEKYFEPLPVARAVPPQGRRFAMNAAVAGLRLKEIADPARTVLFFETGPEGPLVGGQERLRQLGNDDDEYVFAFADGHVERMSGDDLKDLVWQPVGGGIQL